MILSTSFVARRPPRSKESALKAAGRRKYNVEGFIYGNGGTATQAEIIAFMASIVAPSEAARAGKKYHRNQSRYKGKVGGTHNIPDDEQLIIAQGVRDMTFRTLANKGKTGSVVRLSGRGPSSVWSLPETEVETQKALESSS